jgi:V/A-type H+/Na+-transporting ATPase subunit C
LAIFGGRSNYPYLCARVKAKKSFLLKKDVFHRMLSMELAEIGRYLGETQYREEIASLAADYSGATLIEIGLSQNLAKTYSDILNYSVGHSRQLISEYLHRWDIYNVKTIIRGKLTKASLEEIREIIVPAGSLKLDQVSHMVQSSSWEELMDRLRQQKVVYVDEEMLRAAIASGKLGTLEDALDKEYYSSILRSIEEKNMSEAHFLDFMRREIDITNLKTIFKLKSEGASGESLSQYFIPGGMEFKMDRLSKMAAFEGTKELMDEFRQSTYAEMIRADIEQFERDEDTSSILRALDRVLLSTAEKFSHLYPLSVLPVLGYLLAKKTEADNIRIIARGKESNLEPELIKKLLVI